MKITTMFEDAEADVRRSLMADAWINALVSFLYRHMKAGNEIDSLAKIRLNDEGVVPVIYSSSLDVLPILKPIIIAFRDSDYPWGGSATTLKQESYGARYLITIDADLTSFQTLISDIQSNRGKNILRHEIQHVIDYIRYHDKSRLRDRKIVGMKASGEDQASSKYQKTYHNDPLELNAYFHNIAEPLIDRLRWLTKQSPAIEHMPEISRDFREYLASLRGNPSMQVIADHWNKMKESNKRRVISRLKSLFDRHWELYDAYMAKRSSDRQYSPD